MGHVGTLKNVLENRERAFHTMMSDIYTRARWACSPHSRYCSPDWCAWKCPDRKLCVVGSSDCRSRSRRARIKEDFRGFNRPSPTILPTVRSQCHCNWIHWQVFNSQQWVSDTLDYASHVLISSFPTLPSARFCGAAKRALVFSFPTLWFARFCGAVVACRSFTSYNKIW